MPPASSSSSPGAPGSKDFSGLPTVSAAATALLDHRVEAPLVLDTEPPRTLRFRDHFALWMNLGVSLIGFSTAATVLGEKGSELSLAAAVTAIVAGTAVGTAMLGVAALIGARTGAPAMANLRGLFGTRLSYLPTVLNIVQCIGWGVFELLTIAAGAQTVAHTTGYRWLFVLLAGVLTTALTIWPLGSIAVLRRFVAGAVAVAMVYFTVQLGRQGVPDPGAGNWHGFLGATDAMIAVSISFVPMAADYTRHSRTPRSSFWGSFSGYTVAQVWCYVLGLMALLQSDGDPSRIFDSFLGVWAGWLFLLVLVLRETDQSFANVYSTAMSLQNLLPRVDRRVLSGGIGVLTTVLALRIDRFTDTYSNFLGLIGSVFVPLLAVLAVDYFFGAGRHGWDLSERAPSRWLMLLPWVLGFAVYQFIAPTAVAGWWVDFWTSAQEALHFTPQEWTSASLFAFLVPALATWALTPLTRRTAQV
ncbi:purine-cytosine permease family protein [Kitasatospora aureofaciens]|uniref:Cytosine permease n=1 Tax=Kitasatospora aureofaciens TaxID=1894 RepID=A0A8H9HKX9_KITAU|nr:cytosine permease [Kitasatospora aureofaciens]ARF79563.1 allantoin permease [Kitasatospora aureofaciens]GGU65284.1 cytosine permease [Kitasatospora aureofaciens]